MEKKKSGISLIVLVITIIVIIILAVAVILSIANNNPIENANKAKFQNDLKTIQEELTLKQSSNYIDANTGKSTEKITLNTLTSGSKYQNKLIINEGKLCYVKSELTTDEAKWAKEVGVEEISGTLLKNGENGVTIDAGTGVLSTSWSGGNVPEEIGEDIIIPDGVTSIADSAFYSCSGLKSIIIPDSVTSIGSSVFSSTAIKTINIPSSVVSIGEGTFNSCYGLKSIVIPPSVGTIEKNIFYGCSSLESVTISEGVTSIGEYAFYGCQSLKDITIPSSVIEVGGNVFNDAGIKNIVIKGSPRFKESVIRITDLADYSEKWWGLLDSSKEIIISGTGYIPGE